MSKYIFKCIGEDTNVSFLPGTYMELEKTSTDQKIVKEERFLLTDGTVITASEMAKNPEMKQNYESRKKNFHKTSASKFFYMEFDVTDPNSVTGKYVDFVKKMNNVSVLDEFGKESNYNARNPSFILIDTSLQTKSKINVIEIKNELVNYIIGLEESKVIAVAYFLGAGTAKMDMETAKSFVYSKIEVNPKEVQEMLNKDNDEIEIVTCVNIGMKHGMFVQNANRFYEFNGLNCGSDVYGIYSSMKNSPELFNHLKQELSRIAGMGVVSDKGVGIPALTKVKSGKFPNKKIEIVEQY